jgi:5' nucleotidase family
MPVVSTSHTTSFHSTAVVLVLALKCCVLALCLRPLQRTLGWRTCLIVPELEHEIRTHKDNAKLKVYINDLRALQYDLDEWADDLRYKV